MKTKIFASVAAAALLVAFGESGTGPSRPEVEVSEAQVTDALSAMALNESGAGTVVFASGALEGNDYVFTGVEFEGGLTAERLVIGSPRLAENGDVLMQSFSIENATAPESGDGQTVTIERIYIEEPSAALSNLIATGLLSDQNGEEPDLDASSIAFDTFAIEGMAGSGGELQELGLARFALEGMTGEELGRFEIMDFVVNATSPQGAVNVNIDEISLDGFKIGAFSDMIDAIDAGGDEQEIMGSYYEGMMANALELYDSFAMRGIDINAAGVAITMDALTADMERRGDEIISTSELGSLVVKAEGGGMAGAGLAMGLGMLGYDQIEISAGGESVYDTAADRSYTRGDNFLQITDGLRMEFTSDMSGIQAYMGALSDLFASEEFITSMSTNPGGLPPGMMEAYGLLSINSMTITIEDQSILERALNAAAPMQGMTPDQMRAQAVTSLAALPMMAPPEFPRPLLAEATGALTEFINTGGSLNIALTPDEPISFNEIMAGSMDGSVDFEALGLSITHTE